MYGFGNNAILDIRSIKKTEENVCPMYTGRRKIEGRRLP